MDYSVPPLVDIVRQPCVSVAQRDARLRHGLTMAMGKLLSNFAVDGAVAPVNNAQASQNRGELSPGRGRRGGPRLACTLAAPTLRTDIEISTAFCNDAGSNAAG